MENGDYVLTYLLLTLISVSISIIVFWLYLPNYIWIAFVIMPLLSYFLTNILVKRKRKKEELLKKDNYLEDDLYN